MSEFAQIATSLDERYLQNRPSIFIIEVAGESKTLGLKPRDKLIIDRALDPKEGGMVLMVIKNEFALHRFSSSLLAGQDPETGDFVWGVVTTVMREFKSGRAR